MKQMTKQDFDKFIDIWYKRGLNRDKHIISFTDAKRKVVLTNIKTGKRAISMCHKDDEFSYRIGLAIAYARYCGADDALPVYVDGNIWKFKPLYGGNK
jgi:hypothetical protein